MPEKTMKTTPAVSPQQASKDTFFRKPGEGFFDRRNGSFLDGGSKTFFNTPVQAKLSVNAPDDAYEKEADAVADKVMRMPAAPAMPLKERDKELQRKAGDEEGDRMQVGAIDPAPAPGRREQDEMLTGETDAAPLRRKPAGTQEEEDKMRIGDTDMAPLQRKEEEEEMLQAKGEGTPEVTPSFEQNLQSSKGGGSPLPDGVKQQMETGIGADFSKVRVHTGSQAAQLSSSIQAQAFTHGQDIYFNQGKYSPGTDSGKHLLAHELTHTVQQQPGLARKGDDKKPVPVNKVGLVAWDGKPPLKLRAKPSTEAAVLAELPLNTLLQVIDHPAGDASWYHVSTQGSKTAAAKTGYVAAGYVKTNMPEPSARLYRVQPGDTAIGVAQKYYYTEAGKWGMDLRFYVNVLAYVNKMQVPNDTAGWKQMKLTAGNFIWIPGKGFAKGLKGKVNSGSRSYNVADKLGIAGYIEGIVQKMEDFKNAVGYSGQYLGAAVKKRFSEAIMNSLQALLDMLLISAGVLAVTTALGAAIGALFGGVGAAPGAAIGFDIGMLLLEWMGLAFLIKWIADAVMKIGGMFVKFLKTVWNADGNLDKLKKGGKEFAEAIAELLGTLLEAAVMWVASMGIKAGMNKLKGTKLGEKLNVREWIEKKAREKTGESKPVEEKMESKPEEKKKETKEEKEKQSEKEKLPARLPEIKANPPFKAGKGLNVPEFERQIKAQEKGMNELTVEEFLKNREEYKKNGRSAEGSKAQSDYRKQVERDLVDQYMEEGLSKTAAEAKARDYMEDKAALHDPDQVAGGKGENITGLGDAKVNSSIGSQWKTRIENIEAQVRELSKNMTSEQRKSTKLNVHLYP